MAKDMNGMPPNPGQLGATPFHARTSAHNLGNAWIARGGFSVPAVYGDSVQEALAAHMSAVLADISWVHRLRVHGAGATAFLSTAFDIDASAIEAGASRRVMWKTTGGGVRGTGVLARDGEVNFVVWSHGNDAAWFENAATHFGAQLRDATDETGVLTLAGPWAAALLHEAGIEEIAALEAERHQAVVWRGLNVAISRLNVLGSFEIVCAKDDALIVFDRLWRAGQNYGLVLAGEEALETLLLEKGVVLDGVDFSPARLMNAKEPSPEMLGLSVNESGARSLMGLLLDSEEAAGFSPLWRNGEIVGTSLRSAYSPVLRRAIALAQINMRDAAPGTEVTLRSFDVRGIREVKAQVTPLPFV